MKEIELQDIVDMILLLDSRVESGFYMVKNRIDNLEDRFAVLGQQQSKFDVKMADMQDDITTLVSYAEQHSKKIQNHDKRIKKLELLLA